MSKSRLSVVFNVGEGKRGTRTFSNIMQTASDEQLRATGAALASLQTLPVIEMLRVDTKVLGAGA